MGSSCLLTHACSTEWGLVVSDHLLRRICSEPALQDLFVGDGRVAMAELE
jgi:hypothetical protein